MHTPLNASATTAGALLSGFTFEVPPYQREYAWERDEVLEFWKDLSSSLIDESYFLGLVILTGNGAKKQVVDGQQRLLTLTLFATALYHEAVRADRKVLAERIQSDFLRSIDYETDEAVPRLLLSDAYDNETLKDILDTGESRCMRQTQTPDSALMREAFAILQEKLRSDLAVDPFKRLGLWAEFITSKLYFAVFVHPDSGSAYRVFEVINTRGKELTTAHLLKNYALSQTAPAQRDDLYRRWQVIAKSFLSTGASSFVQYIRHVITVHGGFILPRDLFDFISGRSGSPRPQPGIPQLIDMLESNLPIYQQMMDPTLDGPAEAEQLKIFAAMNALSVISVRPILLAIAARADDPLNGMRSVLRLVVRRIVVGNLGTGNVERRFGEVAFEVATKRSWIDALHSLRDLNPEKPEFVEQLKKRSYNKSILSFIRRSIIDKTQTPESRGVLHFIRPRNSEQWEYFSDDEASYWISTLGNTLLATLERRPRGADTWDGVVKSLLPEAIDGEMVEDLREIDVWDAETVQDVGKRLAELAGNVWF
jgi:hypothetical protein